MVTLEGSKKKQKNAKTNTKKSFFIRYILFIYIYLFNYITFMT